MDLFGAWEMELPEGFERRVEEDGGLLFASGDRRVRVVPELDLDRQDLWRPAADGTLTSPDGPWIQRESIAHGRARATATQANDVLHLWFEWTAGGDDWIDPLLSSLRRG